MSPTPSRALSTTFVPLATTIRLEAAEHIRRLRGGSQSHLMQCSDGNHYVVKFPNNPQGSRVLINELFCARLAKRLYLPAPETAVVDVSKELIGLSEELVMELERGRVPCRAGLCFGSRYPGVGMTVFDSWPKRRLADVKNISDFYGMLVFDIWTSNIDFRQVRFCQERPREAFKVIMIDNGDCFSRAQWQFKDKPRLCLYPLLYVYESVAGIEAFEPWLNILEVEVDRGYLSQVSHCIPSEWYGADTNEFARLLDQLDARRSIVRSLILSLHRSSPSVFPNWTDSPQFTGIAISSPTPSLLPLQE
jgi:hypothetical protein